LTDPAERCGQYDRYSFTSRIAAPGVATHFRQQTSYNSTMQWLCWFIFLTDAYPLVRAFRANRQTSLVHAVGWAALAWLGWGGAMLIDANWPEMAPAARYAGLCLIGCAAVAVLGARRPGVAAWNFVVAGLLTVLFLSLAEGVLIGGEVQLSPLRVVFLGGTLAVGVLNYLPTRQALAASLLAASSALEFWLLLGGPTGTDANGVNVADLLLGLVPWAAFLAGRGRPADSELDRLWLDFRDRFGLVWGQRLREQFNRAVVHAGLRCELGWSGLRCREGAGPSDAAARAILRSLMKRFGPPEGEPNEEMPQNYEKNVPAR